MTSTQGNDSAVAYISAIKTMERQRKHAAIKNSNNSGRTIKCEQQSTSAQRPRPINI